AQGLDYTATAALPSGFAQWADQDAASAASWLTQYENTYAYFHNTYTNVSVYAPGVSWYSTSTENAMNIKIATDSALPHTDPWSALHFAWYIRDPGVQ